jgi:hypothetical protein
MKWTFSISWAEEDKGASPFPSKGGVNKTLNMSINI